EIEDLQIRIALQKFFTPEAERDPAVIAEAEAGLARPFKVLDQHLDGRDWLVGDAFGIADLNLAGVMSLLQMVEVDVSGCANIQRWADTCYARPAYARAQRVGE
ncbi:MAG: glutathione binding-like protein, partial [Gammaproteobacteria bacterium]|nr:glutathione binding-like protein [Gammaproteobacteria bacterium]